jgi:hypothetical protein
MKYTEVVDMDPHIQTYHEVYSNELEECLGLQKDRLPFALVVLVLLNPFWSKI